MLQVFSLSGTLEWLYKWG